LILRQTKHGVEFKSTKTEDSVRVVTVPGPLVDALAAHRKIQDRFRRPVRLLFTEPEGNMLKDSTSSAASALCRRLKLPKGVSLHTLRHIHGSHLLAAGMEITAVSERLGHFSARVTQNVYSHTFPGRDHDAARRWEQFHKQTEQPEVVQRRY
jgi:integrase